MMFTGGGRSLQYLLRLLKNDKALAPSPNAKRCPAQTPLGRMGEEAGLSALGRINQRIRQSGITAHTLDADASQIVAEKEAALFTYKGEQGYMPMIGYLAET